MSLTIRGRSIATVGIIGSGNIGPDIALHTAKILDRQGSGQVIVVDIVADAVARGREKMVGKLERGVKSGAFKPEQRDSILARTTYTTDYEALRGADLIIEAATENLATKRAIVGQLEGLVDEGAIIASNSSHLPPDAIFAEAQVKSRTLVIHYFYPAERNLLVEVVPGAETDPALTREMLRFYERIGKVPIRAAGRYGYAIDPIFEGVFLGALLCVEKGLGSVKEVDAVARETLGLGVGPFTAMNLTGGSPITRIGLDGYRDAICGWFRVPAALVHKADTGEAWETAARDEVVSVDDAARETIAWRMKAVFYGLACEIVQSGVATLGDLELGVETGLVMTPPFTSMNRTGIPAALELVARYRQEEPDFPAATLLEAQSRHDRPFTIPFVHRMDDGDVAIVQIRRPAKLNALNREIMGQLDEVFKDVAADEGIAAIVLTGFGQKAFAAGADIKELAATPDEAQAIATASRGQAVLNRIEAIGKPVICAMNGLAFGGGCELAMACHARVAPAGLKVFAGQPEVKLGIIPGYGGSQRLPRWIGLPAAWRMLRDGNPIGSDQALELGLVSATTQGDVVEAALTLARKVIAGEETLTPIPEGPIEVPETLPEVDLGHLSRAIDGILSEAILSGARTTLEEGLDIEARAFGKCIHTEDMRIGMTNFIDNGPRAKAAFIHR